MTELLCADNLQTLAWQAEHVRCTAFLAPGFAVSADSIFRQISQIEATDVALDRRRSVETLTAIFQNGILALTATPGRIDIVWHAEPDAERIGFSVVGPISETLPFFDQSIIRWLRQKLSLQRLALGVLSHFEVHDRAEGYRHLDRLLPKVEMDAEHSSDFSYQINRPRLAQFPGPFSVAINRLSKWSVAARSAHEISAKIAHFATSALSVSHVCRLELDLSTAAECSELPSQILPEIWQCLTNYAQEICYKGDVP